MNLSILPDLLAVCRLEPNSSVPDWAVVSDFWSVTRTLDELSLVCLRQNVPDGVQCEADWRALKVEGPLDFALIGILADLSGALAQAKISLFAISTYDTDYLLVRADKLDAAVAALRAAGHNVEGGF